MKQLFLSRLLDMRWLRPTRRYAPRWLSIFSYPTRARGIIVKYPSSHVPFSVHISRLRNLPNRSDVLPVNMRCTRAAVGQYEVVCRGVWTCLKSVPFFFWFCLCLVCTIFRWVDFESHSVFANLCISFCYVFLGCFFWTDQIVRSACSSIAPHIIEPCGRLFKGNKCLFPYNSSNLGK